jgi:hypothetical protein
MQIDTEHIHHWMQAIRQSSDPMRTMDAFWSGQLKSKEWLIDNLKRFIDSPISINICGGWVGVLASMLFQSNIPIKSIQNIDIDPSCEAISVLMNKIEETQGRFKAITCDMCWAPCYGDVIVNTSCEHLTQEQYDDWLEYQVIRPSSLIVLQSNNYDIPEHVRIAHNLDEFINQSKIKVLWADSLELPLYTRHMIFGMKYD